MQLHTYMVEDSAGGEEQFVTT